MFLRLRKSKNYMKYCSIIGAHFIMSPLSFLFNYGNLSAYLESFFQVYCAPGCADGDSQWIVNTFLACGCPGVFLSWYILDRIGPKKAGIIIMIISNAAVIASAWTLEVSIIGTAMLMGVVNGLGIGPTLCIGFMYINGWAGKNAAFFIGTITSAPTILAIAQNQIITTYVNPRNLEADVFIGERAFFSQPEVLERVPEIVLILGVMGLCLQIIGYVLVTDPPSTSSQISTQPCKTKSSDPDTQPIIEVGDLECSHELPSEDHNVNENKTIKQYGSTLVPQNIDLTANQNGHIETKQIISDITLKNIEKSQTVKSMPPLDVLKSGDFYALFLFGFALCYGLILQANYYKQFGLLYIKNDRFLTLTGSLVPLLSSIARVFLGMSIDKNILSIQDCLVIGLAANSILCAFWYFAPQINDILYMTLILLLSMSHAMIHTSVGTGVARFFGPKHFVINYGMVYFAGTLSSIISAAAVTPLRQAFGWFWLFTSCSILSLVVLIYTSFYDLYFVKL